MRKWIKGLVVGLAMVGVIGGTVVTSPQSLVPSYQVSVSLGDEGGGDE
jgi:hypothetical protein